MRHERGGEGQLGDEKPKASDAADTKVASREGEAEWAAPAGTGSGSCAAGSVCAGNGHRGDVEQAGTRGGLKAEPQADTTPEGDAEDPGLVAGGRWE